MGMKGKGFTASLMRKESQLGFDFLWYVCGAGGGEQPTPCLKPTDSPFFWGSLSSFVLHTELDLKDQARGHA